MEKIPTLVQKYYNFTEFVCHMYGWKGYDSVDEIRYHMYCQRGRKISCQHLPSCAKALELHAMRANYQARIWSGGLGKLHSK